MGSSEQPEALLWEEAMPGGTQWSGVIRRGVTLRLNARGAGANVSALLYNFDHPTERYNMPDTLKAQHTAFLTKGHVCYSDMGRVLCSIVADSAGWNDTVCGASDDASMRAKFGVKRFEEARNHMHRSAREGFLKELSKWGLSTRDIDANINFFSKVTVGDNGALEFHGNHTKAGDYVDLRFEMNAIVVLSTSVHPLDPKRDYAPQPITLSARRAPTVAADDVCRTSCAENQRGFINTERYFAA